MRYLLLKILIILICAAILAYTIIYTPPPANWDQASISQILAIFLSFLILVTVAIDLSVNYLPWSFILGLGFLAIAVLQALKQLTPLIALGIILVSVLGVRLFPKVESAENKEIKSLGLSKEKNPSKFKKTRKRI